jgi:3-deoxy-manno-octulosonate cytidylyltransferase (CMP-KDO synthetase)
VCNQFGIKSIITSSRCLTGTDRVAEAIKKIKKITNKIIINIQGDEPYINYLDIKKFISFSIRNKNSVTNAYTDLYNKKLFKNKNIPKVILKKNSDLLYMSRSSIPGSKKEISYTNKQICMYGFPKKILTNLFGINKKKTPLEKIEDIEILRFIENNIPVKMIKVGDNKLSIDTKLDLRIARKLKKINVS